MTEVAVMPEINLEIVNAQVAAGLARVKEVKEKTAELKEKSATVTISGEDDKAGYALTKSFLGEVRPMRSKLEAERKVCVSPFNNLVKTVNAEYNAAIEALEAIESPHKVQKDMYEAAIEKRKVDEAVAAEKFITDKINLLCQNGLIYDANNGYYKNDVGIAVTRQNIITLSEEDFLKLLERVKARKEELGAIQKAADEKEALAILRRKELLSVGMKMDNEGLGIMDNHNGEELRANFDAITDMSDEEFLGMVKTVTDIKESNAAYHEKIKSAAEETRLKAIEFEKQEEKLKLDKVSVFKDKLEGIGFRLVIGKDIESGRFYFTSNTGEISVTVQELLSDEKLLEAVSSEGVRARLADIENKKNTAAKKEETRKLETQKALNTEARKKKMSRTDLAKIDPLTEELMTVIEKIKATNFELIGKYTLPLTEGLDKAIIDFNISVKHLRN